MHVERELKLIAPRGFALPDLDDVVGAVPLAPARRHLDAVYYDSAELRLARCGVTLRHYTGERPEWTLELPDSGPGAALVRREFTFDGPPNQVPFGASDLVRAYLRGAPLVPVAQLRTDRTLVALLDADGQAVADVVDDEVGVYEGESLTDRFREIEIEAHSDSRRGGKVFDAVVARLSEVGCRADDQIPKLVRALGPRAQTPPDIVVEPIGSDATVAQLIRHTLARSVAQMIRHDAGVRLQVLDQLAPTGQPSRAEITDAAMSQRAECVMLNRGPHIVQAVASLDDILRRMGAHQHKKVPLLPRLRAWSAEPPQ